MKYLNENYLNEVKSNKQYGDAVEKMKIEAETFAANFHDDPSLLSEWGHNYFCDYDGGRLIFDINKPKVHKCEVCGKEFTDPIYDGVWIYMYRNQAVLNAWKAAAVYKVSKDTKHLEIVKKIIGFYAENYTKFKLHNKERFEFDTIEEMKWGCGRILPQGLNESIIAIRMIQALEIVKEDIGKEFLDFVYENMFKEMFKLFKPQVNEIHNIRCWKNSAIGVIGLFFNDQEMIDFVFTSEFGIRNQINKGVTKDYFWYEGSIHYNFFTLEGISALLLFSELYDFDFGKKEKETVKQMFISAYHYAFDNHYLPNPNDGWPSVNLKTYSYIYHTATKAFGEYSEVGNLLKNIENNKLPRTQLPLSKPYYIDNEIALERLLLNTDINLNDYRVVKPNTCNSVSSSYAMLRNDSMNIFVKYGMNGPSHSHPDLINIEVMYKDDLISRDISNAGYRARLCNEWHRKSLCHNTILMNGKDIESTAPGNTISYSSNEIVCEALNVYEGVDYKRSIELHNDGFKDVYEVKSKKEELFDYVFHLESDIKYIPNLVLVNADLGFNINGYEHIVDTKKVVSSSNIIEFNFYKENKLVSIEVDAAGKEVFLLQTMDNPVNKTRTTILVREKGKQIKYTMKMSILEKDTKTIQHYFFNDEIEAKVVGEGVTRKVISYNDNLMVCEVGFEEGSIGALHQHPHEQCTYIVSGEFEFTIGEEKKIVKAGDSLYKEPNIIHGAICLKKGVLIDIFTPCRKDFL